MKNQEKKIPEYKPSSYCAKCKGECCKHMGCHFSPSDFKEISLEYLQSRIEEGYISIDWWEEMDGDPSYYLRMRHIGAPVVDPSWGGRCILLTDKGCPLSFEERPLGAKALHPARCASEECINHYSKEQCKDDWKQYSSILNRLVEHFS